MEDYNFQAEYAKSGRSLCKSCSLKISNGSLRLATIVQSPFYDGKMAKWFHMKCFFKKSKVFKIEEFKGIEEIRYEDQEILKNIIAGNGIVNSKSGKTTKIETANDVYDYTVQYSKSSRAKCRKCEINIQKGEIRISKKVYDSVNAQMYGPQDLWHHVDCFVLERKNLEYDLDQQPSKLNGFSSIDKEDQNMLVEKLGKGRKIAKRENGGGGDVVDAKIPKKMDKAEEDYKNQTKILWEITDALNRSFTGAYQKEILEDHDMFVPKGLSEINKVLADAIYFGMPKDCPVCKGKLIFKSGIGYKCTGDISEWSHCTHQTKTPDRVIFKLNGDIKVDCPYLKKFKQKIRQRLYLVDTNVPNEDEPLKGLEIAISGRFAQGIKQVVIRERVQNMGALYTKNVKASTTFCISTKDEIRNETNIIRECQRYDIHCVDYTILDNLKGVEIEDAIKTHSISSWGQFKSQNKSGKSFMNEKSEKRRLQEERKYQIQEELVTTKIKGGLVVDKDSGLSDTHHVLKYQGEVYSSVLGYVDVIRGTNSYYKLQILESDKPEAKRYYLWRSWGRIGTTIGGDLLAPFTGTKNAILKFQELFLEKSGNEFGKHVEFQKMPRKFYPLDIDHASEPQVQSLAKTGTNSKLEKSVQDVVKLIFDVDQMTHDLMEFEIDLKKMPLGKISQKQIREAFTILNNLQMTLAKGKHSDNAILDASNRFYHVIPHDFGMAKPTLISDNDMISAKTTMLQNLLDIEIAYSMLDCKYDDKGAEDLLDVHYGKLKTSLSPMDKQSDEYARLLSYVDNTHAKTHNQFTLEVQEIFKVERKGENRRFKAFRDLHNHQLLWHGSGVTNYAGILSQGLRIAPPEAPVTGYMFGKGVYFADMVSKSANYCRATRTNPVGLLMLCEVALGDMDELKDAKYVTKLKTGKHSVKGIGRTMPDPASSYTDKDGLHYPMGKGVNSKATDTSLLYNEYIVYDIAQVKVKYLFKTEFKFNY